MCRSKKIPQNMIFAMWFSGLRGAIAFALSVNMPTPNPAIETCTLFVCIGELPAHTSRYLHTSAAGTFWYDTSLLYRCALK